MQNAMQDAVQDAMQIILDRAMHVECNGVHGRCGRPERSEGRPNMFTRSR